MLLQTGQTQCFDTRGEAIPCAGSGQDGEAQAGRPLPEPRFEVEGAWVKDCATGLLWLADAGAAEFPLTWGEALAFVQGLNQDRHLGFADWRLPNRRELRSLVDYGCARVFPADHPFEHLFRGWYWSSTTAAISPKHAWYLDLEGGRLFYGGKDQSFMVWPVRGEGGLAATGQRRCCDTRGEAVACPGSGQDGELRLGIAWDEGRFTPLASGFFDRLSGLEWHYCEALNGAPRTWAEALQAPADLPGTGWRLPNIVELESLADASQARPAFSRRLPPGRFREAYWSSTTSAYEPDWAWALYAEKGALGVGQKKDPHFFMLGVRAAAGVNDGKSGF